MCEVELLPAHPFTHTTLRQAMQQASPSLRAYPVGSFLIQWNAQQKQLSITHQDDRNRVLWQSKASKPFLKVAQGSFSIQEYQGNFNITDDVSMGRVTDDQQVFRLIQEGPKRLRLLGHLICSEFFPSSSVEEEDDDDEQRLYSWSYSILFQEETPHRLGLSIDVHIPEDDDNDDEEEGGQARARPPQLTHVILEYEGDPKERIFGLGTQFTFLNLKGHRVPIWVSEQGVSKYASFM